MTFGRFGHYVHDVGEPKFGQENKMNFRTMTDYLLHPSFLKKPIPTQIAIVKCCERFTKGRPKSVHVIEKGNVSLMNLHLECGPWNKQPMSTQMSTKFLMLIFSSWYALQNSRK